MGYVEISIDKEGVLRVVQHNNLRVLIRRLKPEGFERHRVVKWPKCNCFPKRDQDVYFGQILFLFLISFTVISLFIIEQILSSSNYIFGPSPPNDANYYQMWLLGTFLTGSTGIVMFVMFASILVVGVFMMKMRKNISSAPVRKEEVQTISALVQQV